MELLAVYDGGIHGFAEIIHHDDAAAFPADVLVFSLVSAEHAAMSVAKVNRHTVRMARGPRRGDTRRVVMVAR